MWKEPSTYAGIAAAVTQIPPVHPYIEAAKPVVVAILGTIAMLLRERGQS